MNYIPQKVGLMMHSKTKTETFVDFYLLELYTVKKNPPVGSYNSFF